LHEFAHRFRLRLATLPFRENRILINKGRSANGRAINIDARGHFRRQITPRLDFCMWNKPHCEQGLRFVQQDR
jgi:hypothetical protein